MLQCSSLLVFFLFFQLFFSCPNDDYVLNTHDFHHARFRSGLYQLQGSHTSSREEEAVETAAVAASPNTALSQQEPPVEFYGTPHRQGEMAVGLILSALSCWRRQNDTFDHPLLKSVCSTTILHACSVACSVSCSSHAAPACLLRALAPRGQRMGGLCCVVHSFFTSLMLSILWHCFSQVRLKRNMIVLTKREKEH